jgi:hypothetical protein
MECATYKINQEREIIRLETKNISNEQSSYRTSIPSQKYAGNGRTQKQNVRSIWDNNNNNNKAFSPKQVGVG